MRVWSLLAIAVLGAVALTALWVKERRPAQDLRVSFRIPSANPDNPAITYLLQNNGRQATVVRGVGLLEIADNPPIINDSDNVELCDKVDAASLKPLDQVTTQGASLGDAAQRREEYAPVSLSVAAVPRASGAPIEIPSGQSISLSATYKTGTEQAKGYGNRVFCPILWLTRGSREGGVAVCQGFAMAATNGGVSNTIVARQFQVRPAAAGKSCPVAPQ
ncbi:MAG TPA: hypothetical protein VMB34_26330 [Acetobacteraceae bacterium]|nr:hypothetical protein [Acetobacteraceae bacterium]